MTQNVFPPGWDEERVRRVIDYYEQQTEEEIVGEIESALEDQDYVLIEVPIELEQAVRELIAKYQAGMKVATQ
jgi:hypothetical protein